MRTRGYVRIVGEESVRIVIAYRRRGPFAVTDRVDDPRGFVVTHTPTGLSCGRYYSTVDEAARWMRSLAAMLVHAGKIDAARSDDPEVAIKAINKFIHEVDRRVPPAGRLGARKISTAEELRPFDPEGS